MTRFYFDARFVSADQPDGISRFAIGLLHELRKLMPVIVMVSNEKQQDLLGAGEYVLFPDVTSPKEIFTAFKLNRLGAEVVFSPMQTTSGLGRKFKLILTLHDLIYYRHRNPPKAFSPLVRIIWFLYHLSYWPQRLVLSGSDAVVTVSKTSKAQMERVRITKRPITVIYNAADASEPSTQNRSSSNQVVYMGSFIGYKNVETLVRAMAIADLELVLMSKITPDRKLELEALAEKCGSKVVFANGVSDQEYSKWLSQARALVSASFDEGFGIPVVEAMSSGTPTVLSELAIFKEVAEDAALYFEPRDEHALAAQLKALGNPELWEANSKLGLARAKQFSWANSAAQLQQLVRQLAP
jgi:glycosyltransferase involved in cell wall biosynthesis